MNSPTRATTTPSNSLPLQLEQIGLHALAAGVDDFLARATKQRWSPRQILEHLAESEIAERAHRSLERRLRLSEIKKFKPMADFNWSWPTKIERDVIERALTLDFLPEARNLILMGTNGLGKTMIAQNVCHAAVQAGHSVLFRSAAALLEELHRQTPEGRHCKRFLQRGFGLILVRCIVTRKRPALFRGRHFEEVLILLCVRWYLRYSLTIVTWRRSWRSGTSQWITSRSGAGSSAMRPF